MSQMIQGTIGWQDAPSHAIGYAQHKQYGTPHALQGLWRAVILQAVVDARSQSRKPKMQRARQKAREWILNNMLDFEMVCDLAGYDAECIRRKVLEVTTVTEH